MTRRDFFGASLAWLASLSHLPALVIRKGLPPLTGTLPGATAPAAPWWRDMFSLVSSPGRLSRESVRSIHGVAFRGMEPFGGWYGSSYIDWQKTTPVYAQSEWYRKNLFKRFLFYYDGGEVGEFALFTDDQNRALYSGWLLPQWPGTPPLRAAWFDFNEFFSGGRLGGFKNAQDLHLPPITLPDGSKPANLYDAVGARDLNHVWHFLKSTNPKVTDAQAQASGLAAISGRQKTRALVQDGNGWVTSRIVTTDYGNHQVGDYEAWDLARCYGEADYPDGVHIDNLGDNNLHLPDLAAFGAATEYSYRRFLSQQFSIEELGRMGVSDPPAYDIRDLILRRCGKRTASDFRTKGADPAWLREPLWLAYVVNHARRAVGFHRAKYDKLKAAAAAQGREVLCAGNMIPLFAGHSLIQGGLDVAHFEWNAFRSYHPRRQILGYPPQARSGYICRLAAACSNAGYGIMSLYVSKEMTGETHKNLFLVQAFEALTNRCVLDFGQWYLDQYSPGTPETAGIYARFLDAQTALLSERRIAADIAVIYDQWADVAATTPVGLDLDPFADEYAGWCRYLTMARHQWDVVTSLMLTGPVLRRFRAVLLPSSITLNDAQWAVIQQYAEGGGIVVATGETGSQFGPEKIFAPRPDNPLRQVKGAVLTADQPGRAYERGRTPENAAPLAALLQRAGLDSPVRGNLPEPLTVTIYEQDQGGCTIDFQNNDFDVAQDQIRPMTQLGVEIVLPRALPPGNRAAEWIAPGQATRSVTVTVRPEKNRSVLALTLPDLGYFGTLSLA